MCVCGGGGGGVDLRPPSPRPEPLAIVRLEAHRLRMLSCLVPSVLV